MEKVTINNQDHDTVYKPLPWQLRGLTYTSTGYGVKIPSVHCVKYNGRLRRIYCTTYSNVGHCFIVVNGKDITVR